MRCLPTSDECQVHRRAPDTRPKVLFLDIRPAALLMAVAVAGGLLAISRIVWLRGLRRYSGASA